MQLEAASGAGYWGWGVSAQRYQAYAARDIWAWDARGQRGSRIVRVLGASGKLLCR